MHACALYPPSPADAPLDASPVLGLLYFFDAAATVDLYPVTTHFTGRRVGAKGKLRPRDRFDVTKTVEHVVPVVAALRSRSVSSTARPASGRHRHPRRRSTRHRRLRRCLAGRDRPGVVLGDDDRQVRLLLRRLPRRAANRVVLRTVVIGPAPRGAPHPHPAVRVLSRLVHRHPGDAGHVGDDAPAARDGVHRHDRRLHPRPPVALPAARQPSQDRARPTPRNCDHRADRLRRCRSRSLCMNAPDKKPSRPTSCSPPERDHAHVVTNVVGAEAVAARLVHHNCRREPNLMENPQHPMYRPF